MSNKSEPVARLNFVNMIQSTVTDLAQQYELIAMYDAAYPAAALTSELREELLEVLNWSGKMTMEYGLFPVKIAAAITKLTNLG